MATVHSTTLNWTCTKLLQILFIWSVLIPIFSNSLQNYEKHLLNIFFLNKHLIILTIRIYILCNMKFLISKNCCIFQGILITGRPSKRVRISWLWLCDLFLSSVHNQLIRTLFEAWPVWRKKFTFFGSMIWKKSERTMWNKKLIYE